MYKSYLTHNNGYDSVVITKDDEIVVAAQIDKDIFRDFHADDPAWENWAFSVPYALDLLDDVDEYGDVYVSRTDTLPVEIVDTDLYNSRKDFWRYEEA